jgi:hypothetical protein
LDFTANLEKVATFCDKHTHHTYRPSGVTHFMDLCFIYGYLMWKHPEIENSDFTVESIITGSLCLSLVLSSNQHYHITFEEFELKNGVRSTLYVKPNDYYNLSDIPRPVIPLEDYPLLINLPILNEFFKEEMRRGKQYPPPPKIYKPIPWNCF